MAARTQAYQAGLTTILLLLISAPLYALGWLAGVTVRCVLWVVAAIVAGYKAGMSE